MGAENPEQVDPEIAEALVSLLESPPRADIPGGWDPIGELLEEAVADLEELDFRLHRSVRP